MSIEEVRWLVSVINRRGILDVFAVRWYVVTWSLGPIDTNDITLGISWLELPPSSPSPLAPSISFHSVGEPHSASFPSLVV